MSDGKKGMRIGESVFSICYLLFDLAAGIIFLFHGEERLFLLYGVMTLLLGFGDAFHLVPRVVKNIKGESPKVVWWMDLGLAVTSVTMTVFYILLFYIWKIQNVGLSTQTIADAVADQRLSSLGSFLKGVIWSTALARIALCLMPQNHWFTGGNKNLSLSRNIIFSILGASEIILFLISGGSYGITMAVCILFSFLFYIPVTLFAKENPKIGMLMMPKTIMYVIMISLGLAMIS